VAAPTSGALGEQVPAPVAALVAAYPGFIERIDGNELVWKDGTRMPIDNSKGQRPFEEMLNDPDIKDMFAITYPLGDKGTPPAVNSDPGGIRYQPLFTKMYGSCQQATANAGSVVWLPKKYGKTIKFTRVNGAAAALQQVSQELEQLPERLLDYVKPLQGTYN